MKPLSSKPQQRTFPPTTAHETLKPVAMASGSITLGGGNTAPRSVPAQRAGSSTAKAQTLSKPRGAFDLEALSDKGGPEDV